ncbi:MAG: signal peptidase I [Actinobacteria bacterium]|nr:signal peptidase I [Actinomycetota bacterium]
MTTEETEVTAEQPQEQIDDEPKKKPKSKKRSVARQVAELPLLVLVAFVIAIIIKTFLVQAFFIPSGSMIPTLKVGDRVLVEKISYRLRDPARGDIIVFAREILGPQPDVPWYQDARNFLRELVGLPIGDEEDFIKRVVAVSGDSVRYAGNPRTLYVNGEEVEQPFIHRGVDRSSPTLTKKDCQRLDMKRSDDGCLVPAGRVFVMGDNRGNSQDSRFLGPIEDDKIIGRGFVVIWPIGHFGSL